MPQTCSVCKHEQRREIERDLLSGKSLRDIGLRYDLSHTAVDRHRKRGHVLPRIERGFDLQRIAEASDLLEQIRGLLHESAFILEDAREGERIVECPRAECGCKFSVKIADVKDRVAAAAQVGRTLELVGKVTGQIASPTVQAFMVQIGAPDESYLRSALDLRRSMSVASVEDVESELLASMRFLLAERPEFRNAALALLGHEIAEDVSEVKALPESPSHANGGASGANGHGAS